MRYVRFMLLLIVASVMAYVLAKSGGYGLSDGGNPVIRFFH